ncbi:MAG: Type 1 glutamine amidotransferase-like domain-containing protein [Lachnospiraceae bacterium]|nr:Type 1 glutamine amidotransferase-like domain-containing protein [Lachnospiraceae bacterium]
MKVLLTSCGLETAKIEKVFMDMLPKEPEEIKAIFVPTAAIYPDAIEVLHKCLEDLLKCGIKRENIFVYDLHDEIGANIRESYDVIYFCGGDPRYLLRRINEKVFRKDLMEFIDDDGVVLGVSAGSIIFADNIPDNLGLLKCPLDVHCSSESREKVGSYSKDRTERIKLGNEQAIVFEQDKMVIFE